MREVDFRDQFAQGLPIKIDARMYYVPAKTKQIRAWLVKQGYPHVHIEVNHDLKPPFGSWIECDWAAGKETKQDRRDKHEWGKFFTEGTLKVIAMHEDIYEPAKLRTRVRTWLKKHDVEAYDIRVEPIAVTKWDEIIPGFQFINLAHPNNRKEE